MILKLVFPISKTGFEITKTGFQIAKTGFEITKTSFEIAKTGFEFAKTGFENAKTGFEFTSAERRSTLNSLPYGRRLWSLRLSFFVLFALTLSLSFFHASAMMTRAWQSCKRLQCMVVVGALAYNRSKIYFNFISFYFDLI